jgi:hypothetical protein
MSEISNQLWAKCEPCGHLWKYGDLPIDLRDFGKLTRKLRCPKCDAGAKKIRLPKTAEVVRALSSREAA